MQAPIMSSVMFAFYFKQNYCYQGLDFLRIAIQFFQLVIAGLCFGTPANFVMAKRTAVILFWRILNKMHIIVPHFNNKRLNCTCHGIILAAVVGKRKENRILSIKKKKKNTQSFIQVQLFHLYLYNCNQGRPEILWRPGKSLHTKYLHFYSNIYDFF